ncbi:BTBD3_6 [Mytilus coruscus]|uniref:BTBD3_6 n=1 Tax=Mytilus coruscus TaxID=42192 RepID=A0A6J8E5U0_MYTCO|nr:BTBD3_6 [Mytilus coruscus]
MSNIALKLKDAFQEQLFCDVRLTLQNGSLLKCHSVVLLINSDFFQGRLSGRWDQNTTIDCTLFPSDVMTILIKYLYGINPSLNIDVIPNILQACDYYAFNELKFKCITYIDENISRETVFNILALSEEFTLTNISTKCLNFIDTEVENLLLNFPDGFYDLPIRIVLKIIYRDNLQIHEQFLFDCLIIYEEKYNKDDIWKQIKYHVRYLSMSLEYFVCKVVQRNILPADVTNKILLYLSSNDKVDFSGCDIISLPRNIDSEGDICVKRFFGKSSDPSWEPDKLVDDRLTFSVSRNIKLKSVILYGSPNESFIYSLSLYEQNGDLIQNCKTRILFQTTVFPIVFPRKMSLRPETKYTLVAIKTGPASYSGVGGVGSCRVQVPSGERLRVKFENSLGLSTIGKGQFNGLVFSEIM